MNFFFGRKCRTCEVLQEQLDRVVYSNEQLLAQILEMNRPKPAPVIQQVNTELKPIGRGVRSWDVQRQMLEANSRKEAELLRQKREESEIRHQVMADADKIENLEKEVGVIGASE